MGRCKLGDFPLGRAEPLNKRVARSPSRLPKVVLMPTRRKPLGYYTLLGVPSSASSQTILRAWRRLSLQHHPDKAPTSQAKGQKTKQQQLLNEAKEVLLSPEQRSRYDEKCCFACSSTLRSREHRRRLSQLEKRVVSAITVGRKHCKKKPNSARGAKGIAKRKITKGPQIARKRVTAKSKCVAVNDSWLILKRKRSERKRDRRLSAVQAVPLSRIRALKLKQSK